MELRDYQLDAIERAERSRSGTILIVAPTGAGKGTMATELIARAYKRQLRSLFVVHRREIIQDIVGRLEARGVPVGQTRYSHCLVRVLSVQTVMRMAEMPSVDQLVLDEAHHYAANEWGLILAHTKPKRTYGFTATPQRSDGRPLGDMFKKLVDVVSYSELLKQGFIVGARTLRPRAQLSANDLAQDPVEAYIRYGRNERALIFVRHIEDAEEAALRLRARGVRAGVNHSRMKGELRDQTMADLESGKLQVVANVGVLTEGVDLPHVCCIVLARPCTHSSTYVQIVGRVLRAAPGKTHGTLIDLVGASHRHGLPAADRTYSLDGDGIGLEQPTRPYDDERARSGEPKDPDILDLELEEVAASCANELQYAPREPKPVRPGLDHSGFEHETPLERRRRLSRQRYAEQAANRKKAPTGPLPMSPGFIYESNGFWNLRWREHGAKQRMGLSTASKDVAENCLRIYREKGPKAVEEEVRERKRGAVSSYFDKDKDMFMLVRWDAERIRRERKQLYTKTKSVADELIKLFQKGRDRQAEKIIDRIRTQLRESAARGNFDHKRAEARRA